MPTEPARKHHALDVRVAKVEGFTFDQVQSALCEAVEELYPDLDPELRFTKGPWIRDVYDDKVVFCWEGQLNAVGYTFADGKATLAGQPTPVKVEYVPLGGAAAGSQANAGEQNPSPSAAAPAKTPETPNAEAGKAHLMSAIFTKADESIAALQKRATPSTAPPVKWPTDMSPRGRTNVAITKG